MSRYIDTDLLKDKTTRVNNIWNGTTNAEGKGLDEIIDDIPTADVVEVVRCKDCKHLDKGENDSESWCECTAHFGKYFAVNEDGFCSFGERADT